MNKIPRTFGPSVQNVSFGTCSRACDFQCFFTKRLPSHCEWLVVVVGNRQREVSKAGRLIAITVLLDKPLNEPLATYGL